MAKKILFIEDEMRLQEVLGAKLKAEGYEILAAMDGKSGLEIAEKEKPDLILLDLILPKMDGFHVLEAIKANPSISVIPIIVLSNLESGKDIERCLSLGVRSYLAKTNYSLEEIAQKVSEVFK
ncbi:MAG: response regulator [Candidatus Tagabacteria bacterium CG_4_9_14_0_2_um_filter_41_11]|uniref:Response regulator n=2 Tax=Candidatus Tagaibacteriota TaxID=1817918 RepID=A0A2M8G9L6_9BACT|nr:MAG: response regulator [Candidatus Tagabacteria bacterium CG_4_9_14_0_2_um_filter_41_11]PJC70206.1 MAG: response regulator [Candidatus Tagabacteria bacterium CG_4_8_14_3_um_filter_41_8]